VTTTPEGLLLVDKPGGLTSHDVVARVRRLAGTRKVGHAGTLDPMATGLLVLGIGRATRLLTYLVGADKCYEATIRLGQQTSTDDAEGEVTSSTAASFDVVEIEAEVAGLRGEIQQVPSAVSAIKVDGKRAYARVRAGEQVELAARAVTIDEFEIIAVRPARAGGLPVTDVDVRVRCSSGTYIRALARDLGRALGAGGHLTALRRTSVGPFEVGEAMTLPERRGGEGSSGGGPPLDPPAYLALDRALAAAFPIRIADEAEARALSYGQAIPASSHPGVTGVLGPQGQALALVENRDGAARPVVVFAPA